MAKKFIESSILSRVINELSIRNYGWNDFCTEATIKSVFEGMAVFLGRQKSKDVPTALNIKDMDGNFVFAAVAQYHKEDGEESADSGSWTLSYTFNEDDIDTKNWKVYDYPDDALAEKIIYDIAFTKFGISFIFRPKDENGAVCRGSGQELICIILDVIKSYMKENVGNDPVLEFPDYFTMVAELSGEKVYTAITPSAMLKQHIKEDASISDRDINDIPVAKGGESAA